MSVVRGTPDKITVIAKHQFSVVFGVGSNKFRTDVVEDLFDNPVFNTESEIAIIDASESLVFTVSEKHEKDILGQVIVHLNDISKQRTNRPTLVHLQPHKKCPHPEGELSFEAWVSSTSTTPYHHSPSQSISSDTISMDGSISSKKHNFLPSGLKKLREKITLSPMLSRKSSDHKRSSSDTMRGSMSCHDLNSLSSYHPGPSGPSLKLAPADSLTSLDSLTDSTLQGGGGGGGVGVGGGRGVGEGSPIKPEVTGVSPREGPIEGGTKVTVRGVNLGVNKEDVIGLFICGSNVLATLEYISSSKLICTTKAWRACVGNVTVETQSGGKGSSLVQFSFIGGAPGAVDQTNDSTSELSSLSRSSSRGDADYRIGGMAPENMRSLGGPATSNLQALKNNLKAKSMFDISGGGSHTPPLRALPPAAVPEYSVAPVSRRPEVTGVSPNEGHSEVATRLTVRGLNLGLSAQDIVRITVAGTDCTDTLDYESPSKLVCFAGPWNPGKGDVIVETLSGGVGTSLVQFSFVDGRGRGAGGGEVRGGVESRSVVGAMEERAGSEETSWAAVPYSDESIGSIVGPAVTAPAEIGRLSASSVIRIDRQPSPTVTKQPPPIGEIQPIRVQDGKKPPTSPHHRSGPAGLFQKKRGSGGGSGSWGGLDSPEKTLNGISEETSSNGQSQTTTTSMYNDTRRAAPSVPDDSYKIEATVNQEKVLELERKLSAIEDQSLKLQQDNIRLREENERMRRYMEGIVSRAIITCPQILCVDTGK